MFTATLRIDLLLGDVHSLKAKRSIVRPVLADLRRRFPVAAAEVGHLDLHRRAELGVAVVSAEAGHAGQVLEEVERFVAARPELDVLSARRSLHSDEDD